MKTCQAKEIALTNCSGTVLIDTCDFPLFSRRAWRQTKHGYAVTTIWLESGKSTHVYMHRLILNPKPGIDVDHINGNKLDNRRANLRLCSPSQNIANAKKQVTYFGRPTTSKYKGVCSNESKSRPWRAQVFFKGKQRYAGSFVDEVQAAIARDRLAIKLFGSRARLNFAEIAS